MKNVARVKDGQVVNVEVMSDDAASTLAPGEQFVPYDDANPAHIGYGYDAATGFEQPLPTIDPLIGPDGNEIPLPPEYAKELLNG